MDVASSDVVKDNSNCFNGSCTFDAMLSLQKKINFKMDKNKHEKRNVYLGVAIIFILFIIVSYFVENNLDLLKTFAKQYSYFGLIIFILILILETIFIPISAIPFIPIISNSYGIFTSVIVILFGWVAGGVIAFAVSRKFGKPFIRKIIPLERIEEYENLIPEHKKFLSLILIRFFVPFDVVNYLLGLFTKINLKTFFLSTLISTIPLTLILVYIGTLPVGYQIISLIIFILFVVILGIEFKKINSRIKIYNPNNLTKNKRVKNI